MSTIQAKIILNIKTQAEWASSSVVLLAGELGITSDTHVVKVGNGSSTWNNLPEIELSSLTQLKDVDLTGLTSGKVLRYNGTKWAPYTIAGYLPLTGGTLTGDLTLDGSEDSSELKFYNGDITTKISLNDENALRIGGGTPPDSTDIFGEEVAVHCKGSGGLFINYVFTSSGLLPRTTGKTIGDSTYYWDRLYTRAIIGSNQLGSITFNADENTYYDVTNTSSNLGKHVFTITGSPKFKIGASSIQSYADFIPNTYESLGTSTKRWSSIYCSNIDCATSLKFNTFKISESSAGVVSFTKSSDAKFNIASGYVSSVVDFIPSADNSLKLGGMDSAWSYAYINNVYAPSGNLVLSVSDTTSSSGKESAILQNHCFRPNLDGHTDLGNSSFQWKQVYSSAFTSSNYLADIRGNGGVILTDTTNNKMLVYTSAVFRPNSEFEASLGTTGLYWSSVYSGSLLLKSSNQSTTASIIPQTDGNWVFKKSNNGTVNRITFTFDGVYTGVALPYNGTAWTGISDRRLKKGVTDLESSLEKILSLRPVRFAMDTDNTDNPNRVGFIAQEVQEAIPDVVYGEETEDTYLSISLEEFVPFIVKSIQELKQELTSLKELLGI